MHGQTAFNALDGDTDTVKGFDTGDVLVPFIASGIAIWAISGYPITEEKAHDVRQELERRRGLANQPVVSP